MIVFFFFFSPVTGRISVQAALTLRMIVINSVNDGVLLADIDAGCTHVVKAKYRWIFFKVFLTF